LTTFTSRLNMEQTTATQTDGPEQTTVVIEQTMAAQTGGPGGMEVYLAQSAKQCPLNSSFDCCTCRCCGCCVLVLWVIYGIIGAAWSFSADYNDGIDMEHCHEYTGIEGECCAFYEGDGVIVYIAASCDDLQMAITMSGMNDLLIAVAGIVGLLGMAQMAATLLLAPMCVSVISVLIDFGVMGLLWYEWHWRVIVHPSVAVAISLVICLLFFKNWKLIKTFNPKGSDQVTANPIR